MSAKARAALVAAFLLLETSLLPAVNAPEKKPRPFVDLVVSIIIPSVILMKFSGEQHLGPTGGLLVALAFPVTYGLYDLVTTGTRNWVAVLGVVSVLLTGGIGLLKLDPKWLAVKEAAIPLAIGIGVLVAKKMGFPLINKLLLNPSVMNVDRIDAALQANKTKPEFNEELGRMTLLSYPVIAIPSMIMMFAIFYFIWRTINRLTGLKLEEVLVGAEEDKGE